jgi:hypothetical protein
MNTPVLTTCYFTLFITCCFNTVFAQHDIWIDKDENEDYVARHECSFVQAGKAFIMFGGREQAQQLDIYNYTTNTWSTGGSAPKEFNHFQATFYEGFIWVIGSFKTNTFPNEIPADRIWLYFPPTKTWIRGPEIPKNRRRGGAGLALYDDKFYLIGGNTKGHNGGYVNWFDVYSPITNSWTVLNNAPNARDHFSAVVANNKLYAIAGRQSGGEGGVFTPLIAPVDVYDFKTKTWAPLKQELPTPRAAPCIALFNNELFVMGGEGSEKGPAYHLVEAYNLKTKTWSKKADMRYPRHGTQAIVSGKGIYVAGGSPKRGGGRQRNMEVYNCDAPSGKNIIPSILKVPKTICISVGNTKTIKIKNTSGNSGIFITSIRIENDTNNAFKLLSDYGFKLIKHNQSSVLNIQHINTSKNTEAKVVITYNGNHKAVIQLSSK